MATKTRLKYPLDEVKSVVKKHLFIEDDSVVDVMIAAHLANRLEADPLWMLFVAPPSTNENRVVKRVRWTSRHLFSFIHDPFHTH